MDPVIAPAAIGTAALTFGRGVLSTAGKGMSFAAELLQGASGSSSNSQASPAKNDQLDTLKQRMADMQQRIGQQLAAAGIQLTQPVDLVSNGQGGIAVAGPHPQQAAVEEALGSDVLLERDFNQLAGDYQELQPAASDGDMPPTMNITVPTATTGP
jgi:hypothetical protein